MASNSRTYQLSPRARDDLEDIWLYTVKTWSLNQAEVYLSDIFAAFEALATGEKLGKLTDIRSGYFKFLVGAHVLYYTETEAGLNFIRILHQQMDVERHL